MQVHNAHDAGFEWAEGEHARALAQVLTASAIEFFIFHPNTFRILEMSQNLCHKLGYNPDELAQRDVTDICSGLSREEIQIRITPLLRGESDRLVHETSCRRQDGSTYAVVMNLHAIKTERDTLMSAHLLDITERRVAQAKFIHLFESFPDAILILDRQDCIESNRAAITMFGVRSHPEMQSVWSEMNFAEIDDHNGHLRCAGHPLRQAISGSHFHGEVLLRRANGDSFPVWAILSPLMESGRQLSQLILRDISALKQTEAALRESEERFSLAMAGANDGLWDWNLLTDDVYFSSRWKQMLGYEDHELAHNFSSWSENVHPTDLGRALCEIEDYLNGKIGEYAIVFRMRHKEGHYLDILSRGILVRDENGMPRRFVGTHVDVSERKKAEQLLKQRCEELAQANATIAATQSQLFQAEKMASIGELAAGIAHEINNPVGFVSSNISTLKEYTENLLGLIELYTRMEHCPTDEMHWKDIRAFKKQIDLDYIKEDIHVLTTESEEGIKRVVRIVKDLKSFSHMGHGSCELSDLHIGLDSTLNLAHNEIKYKATLVKEYGDLPLIYCNPSQINQVFMNLVVNAARAIETQGTITIRSGRRDDDWGWVEVSDTGSGIPDNIKTRIFEPFFTTKAVGKGTGLGLAISYRVIESHGGRIELESVLGRGSTFRVVLPLKAAG